MTDKGQTIVLDHQQIALIIERFAHQIYEQHHAISELVLIGVDGRGYDVAARIHGHLEKISEQELSLHRIKLNKSNPSRNTIKSSIAHEDLDGKTVILIDDVLNSGRTLVYALNHLLKANMHKVTTVVLVDRIHRNFPIRADIVGMTLSTTIQDRVEVELGKKDFAYLV